jgi:4-hydroxy-tetrahydrodipicolinate synthase
MFANLQGVIAAAITPLNDDFSIDLTGIPRLLDFLAGRGCNGALLFGTTGEGPSFAPAERLEALRVALNWRKAYPDFRLLAGAGIPSLQETIELTQAVFDLGIDGVVTLPPYYFRKVHDDGLFAWFSQVIRRAVPNRGALFGYHIPNVSAVPRSLEVLARLKEAFPERFAGIKDSSGDPEFARQLGERFGEQLVVLTGNDRLFSLALTNQAVGCITAMANLFSSDLRQVWLSFQSGDRLTQESAQATVTAARAVMDRYPPFPPLLKALYSRQHAFPRWAVRPPLLPLPEMLEEQVLAELQLIQ